MDLIKTKNPNFTVKFATPDDAELIVDYMKKLGEYQKMLDKITSTKESVLKLLLEKKGEAILGYYNEELVSFAYFYENSSAFIGETGLYIDAFYVDENMRFKGIGKIMMAFMSKLATERGCKRLEWGCLDWNESAIKFYKELGAVGVDIMTIYRFPEDKLISTATEF
ncbi:GNAT family N-acetyltransferase [Clostridium grantii]|uniref:Acetyltransferase (GNAT) family protein n=1 Tax=Clostridium grantii DSM 8605 TaxID=1121316 RepID=A0A1M5W1R3_9CLOT|nr:GNAT family N-acetyltransferase [Clostridium grantii]SHH81368.1 Acetyltransferase (GNAT) family protein [Clostridium grantii DSM 8605]